MAGRGFGGGGSRCDEEDCRRGEGKIMIWRGGSATENRQTGNRGGRM